MSDNNPKEQPQERDWDAWAAKIETTLDRLAEPAAVGEPDPDPTLETPASQAPDKIETTEPDPGELPPPPPKNLPPWRRGRNG